MQRRPINLAELEAIPERAFAVVDFRYGSGSPDYSVGHETDLLYHNGYHSRRAASDMDRLAEAFDFGTVERAVASTIASSHDVFHSGAHGLDELRSYKWLEPQLQQAGLPEKHLIVAKLAILGSEPIFDENGKWIDQRAFSQEYPSAFAELAAHLFAAADAGMLFTPEGPLMGHLLFKESAPLPDIEALAKFQANQVELLNGFRYRPAKAGKILATHRPEVIGYAERLQKQLQKGNITSVDAVLARDRDFALQHAA